MSLESSSIMWISFFEKNLENPLTSTWIGHWYSWVLQFFTMLFSVFLVGFLVVMIPHVMLFFPFVVVDRFSGWHVGNSSVNGLFP